MNIGLKILVENALVPFDAALGACTINPADASVDDRKGKLSAGYDADIVVLSNEYDVLQTYCREPDRYKYEVNFKRPGSVSFPAPVWSLLRFLCKIGLF